jgi:hypothetical protein
MTWRCRLESAPSGMLANEQHACQALDRIMKVSESDAKMTPKPSKSEKREQSSFPDSRPNHVLR